MRLAVLYAVLDERTEVGVEHLQAALAVWRYCEESASYIFGDATGDVVADQILTALRSRGEMGMSRTDIRDLFARHGAVRRINIALSTLEAHDLAHKAAEPTGGRPIERWYAGPGGDKSDVSDKSRGAS